MSPKRLLIPVLLMLVLAVAAFLVVPRLRPHVYHGMVLQSPDPAADFTLTAHTGQSVTLSSFRGQWVALYFGYTFCPDVCPLTLGELSRAMGLLGDKASDVQVLMVSVDPERDTPERLSQYVPAFHPNFLGLTGTVAEVTQAATPFGIFFEKHEVEGASGYLLDHTATVMLLDPQGRVRLVWPFQTSAEFIAADLNALMK